MVKAKERLKSLEEMSAEERAAYDKKSPAAQAEYNARLTLQTAEDNLAKAKKDAEDNRAAQKRSRAIEAGVKKIITAIRGGEIKGDTPEALEGIMRSKLAGLVITSTGATAYDVAPPTEIRESLNPKAEEIEAAVKIIKEGIAKAAATGGGTRAARIEAPKFTLTHALRMVTKAELMPPTDGSRPDATLTALIRRFGHVSPLMLMAVEGGLYIFDGKRRYHLLTGEESVPAVVIGGFPDEYTAEAAEIAINRGRSLNTLRAAEVISRSRTRGKKDAEIRADMGFKTGELDKYAAALNLPPAILQGIKDGRITPATALTIGKQAKTVQEALAEDFTKRRGEEKEGALARITEADVETARQARAKEAVTRDAGQLSALTQNATPEAAGAGGGAAAPVAIGAEPLQGAEQAAPASPSPLSAANTAATDKSLDSTAAPVDNAAPAPGQTGAAADQAGAIVGGEWVEGALDAANGLLGAIPQDAPAPVLPLFVKLRDAIVAEGRGTEYANAPDDNPPATFQAPKKASVENTVEARPGWKASVLSKIKPLTEAVDVNATGVLEALNEFKAAVSSAKPGANS